MSSSAALASAVTRVAEPEPPTPKAVLAASGAPPPAVALRAGPFFAGKKVLLTGDSMVGGEHGLRRALEPKLVGEGAKFVRDFKVSESIASFDKETLGDLLARHHPDVVILTLGANDVFVPHPQANAYHVRNIAKRIAPRECWWIGPPTWKPDTGIVKVIEENLAPCRFFDSSNLELERTSDGIHPTNAGGQVWADRFWEKLRTTPAP